MKSPNTFSISFFLKKDKTKNGSAPLYARITVNGDFKDISTKRWVLVSAWNQKEQKLSGKTEEDTITREKIRLLNNKINISYDDLKIEKQIITADTVKARAEGTEKDPHTINFLMKYHNEDLKDLIEEGTLKNYRSTARFIEEFLINKKKRKDIYLAQVDNIFITDFGLYLRKRVPDKGQRPCSNNTLMKHMERLKKVFKIARTNKWMNNDPFLEFERKIIPKDRDCFDSNELHSFRTIELSKRGHSIVQDIFLFCCLTGLAYGDITRFATEHLIKDSDGEYWIEMCRKKTKNFTQRKFHVLLLPEALELINRYKRDPASVENGTIFPHYSNQTVNRYLKIIAKEAKINKPITFHLARHTFATTVTLENGVPMESVSHMLGHASIRTTQIYSKVKKKKVFNDMDNLRQKMVPKCLKAV